MTHPPANPTDAAQVSRYLRVQDMDMFANVLFAPRRPIRGLYAGRHTSRQRGHCVEFNDYREYTPGDEVGDIDWKVFGRSDRLFIKLFEHQTDMTVNLLVDASASMGYAGLDPARPHRQDNDSWINMLKALNNKRNTQGPRPPIENPSKYDQACLMAAAIAFLTVRQQDRVGCYLAQRGLYRELPARGGFTHLHQLLRIMDQAVPRSGAQLADALQTLTTRMPRRSLLIVFSDLMENRDGILRALSNLTARGGEAIVFHVLHEDELRLPDLDEAVFVDSETGRHVRLSVPDVREKYEARVRDSSNAWHNALTSRGMDYHLVSTATHYHEAIRDYLFTRAARV
jgi:uncharacterized protein (DUF58 family)